MSLLSSLDMSLDDLISKKKESKPKGGTRGGRNGRGGRGGRQQQSSGPIRKRHQGRHTRQQSTPYRRRNNDAMDMDMDDRPRNAPSREKKGSIFSRLGAARDRGFKIAVKNLKFDILEGEIKELFDTVGKVLSTEIVYDRAGRSTGVAYVTFSKLAEAEKAIKQYHERTLDGRPMRITLETNVKESVFGTALNNSRDQGRDSQRGRGRGRGGRGQGRGQSSNRKKVTKDELDKDMESYMMTDD